MLKQSSFFKTLSKRKISAKAYYYLYSSYNLKELSNAQKQALIKEVPSAYITADGNVSEQGVKLIKEIDALFKPLKKLKDIEVLGDNYSERIEEFIDLFPSQKLPSNKYARGNKKDILNNFMWFFQEYTYDWETILDATELYVNEFAKKNYLYMRTAQFFIKKLIDGTVQSELATYCEIILNKEDYIPERVIKTKVV